MAPFRYREDESSSTTTVLGVVAGAIAGFALGVMLSDRMGGIDGIKKTIRRRRGGEIEEPAGQGIATASLEEFDDFEDDEIEDDDFAGELEQRVLEAFRNDPLLSERAVDIGSIGDGIIELAGWVDTEEEAQLAVTIARGVPDVDTVVNRLSIGMEESRLDATAQRLADGDPALTEAHWDSNIVGTGKRRQGRSDEIDRHADPRVELKDRWSKTDVMRENAADDTEAAMDHPRGGRKTANVKGDRTGGSPIAPTGVPKADHVADPLGTDGV